MAAAGNVPSRKDAGTVKEKSPAGPKALAKALVTLVNAGIITSEEAKSIAEKKPVLAEHKEEIEKAQGILRLYAPHLLAEDKQRKKVVRLHEYKPNWDMLKPGTPIRHREEHKTSGEVDEWAGVYRSPKELVRLAGGTEVLFKSLNAFREAHLGWCIENAKTNKTTKTGNAYAEMEFCGPDGVWRLFDVIRHKVQRSNNSGAI